MFSTSAELYDLIYSSFKDYREEAAQVAALIRGEAPHARTILDVACGTGEHARWLTADHGFSVDGLDLDPAFVRIARAKLPPGRVHSGDMVDFQLPGRYDVVLCLFSSIGYVGTQPNVTRALERFGAHLEPGGAVFVEPWFAPGDLEPGHVSVRTVEADGVTVCRMSHTEVDGRLSRLRFEYLVGRRNGIEHSSEIHELGMLTRQEMLDSFAAAGLPARYRDGGPSGRGLFIARAPEAG